MCLACGCGRDVEELALQRGMCVVLALFRLVLLFFSRFFFFVFFRFCSFDVPLFVECFEVCPGGSLRSCWW